MKRVFDFATIGFRPHAETGEFVTVGVVVYDAAVGAFDFTLVAPGRPGRMKKMFPGVADSLRKAALEGLEAELEAVKRTLNGGLDPDGAGGVFPQMTGTQEVRGEGVFGAITTSRDGLFHYPVKGRRLAENMAEALGALEKRFLRQKGLTLGRAVEEEMAGTLRDLLKREHLMALYQRNVEIGPANYRMKFTLAHLRSGEAHRADRVLRPRSFDQKDSTAIFMHADEWRQRLHRLESFGYRPERCLVYYRRPVGNDAERQDAFAAVLEDYKRDGVEMVAESDPAAVLDFARIAEPVDLRLG